MSVYETVTNQILQALENGCVPWHKPWATQLPMNLISKKEYRGINLILLGMSGYANPYWMTYKQAKGLGGYVKAKEKGTHVVYYNLKTIKDKEDGGKEKTIPFMRSYVVFNIEQTEGISYPESETSNIEPLEACESLIEGMPNRPAIEYGGNVACYFPKSDLIRMPHRDAFESAEEYYGTIWHELVHATGAAHRLNRKGIEDVSPYGSESYSKEELVAELGASFMAGIMGIESHTLNNSAAYINGWLKELKNDKRLIVTAASQAQKAVDYIRGIKHENSDQ